MKYGAKNASLILVSCSMCQICLLWKVHSARISRLQNSRLFFSKSVKKSEKRAVRVLRARSARASHVRRACEAREKKTTVRFQYNEFVPTRGFKNVVELSKIWLKLHPLCEFDTLGNWFRGRIARVIACTWLRALTLYPVILKQFLELLHWIKWKIKNERKWQ